MTGSFSSKSKSLQLQPDLRNAGVTSMEPHEPRSNSTVYLGEWRLNCQGLLQLEELADEVLLRKAQGFQFAEDLLEYLQEERRTSVNLFRATSMRFGQPHPLEQLIYFCLGHLVKLGPVGHVQVRGGHVAHVQQRRRLGAPAVGALHRQLVQAGGGACQLPRAAVEACK